MKRAFMPVSAAAIAIGVVGSVAAAPISVSTPAPAKTSVKHAAPAKTKGSTRKTDPPKLSKWQLHIQDELKVSAPGDEYFGRMKMSYLGINNTFRDDLIRAGAYTTDPHLLTQIEWADDALTSWSHKYPNDPQLARSYFLAFQMYRKIWVQTYQQKAWDYAHIVIKKWPNSFFGKTLKKDLSIGFTEHYFATPVACADLTVAASPNPHATATPSATPSPTPTPTPTPAPGQPKTDVLPVPCLTPPPSPTPLPTGSLLPSPAASGSPSPSATPGAPTRTTPTTPTPGPTATATPTATPTHRP